MRKSKKPRKQSLAPGSGIPRLSLASSSRRSVSISRTNSGSNDFPSCGSKKKLREKCRSLVLTVKTQDADWKLRVRAMNQLEHLIRNEHLAALKNWEAEFDTGLKRALGVQLSDLRSGVVKEACKLLVATCTEMGDRFDNYLEYFLRLLFKGLYVTIKVISGACHDCLRALLQRCHTHKGLAGLLGGATDAHALVRRRCSEYLTLWFRQNADRPVSEAHLSSLLGGVEVVIRNNIVDGDKDVRAATRDLFECFATVYPDKAQELYAQFPEMIQRSIHHDRKHRAKSSKRQK